MNQRMISKFTHLSWIIFSTISCLMLFFFSARSQSNKLSSNAALAEKVYLQLDNNVYTNDQTIWFRSVVTNAADHAATTLSGVLYVELIDQNEKLVEKKLVRLGRGTGNGFFQLTQQHKEGLYLVRAYTQWAKNFGAGFFFSSYIRIFAASGQPAAKPVKNIVLTEAENNQRRVRVDFDPAAIDSLHTKELTVLLSFDEKTDTLYIKKNQLNGYQLDYAVPAGSRLITVQMTTKNNFKATRKIILDKNYLDLRFYPESGQLVQGLAGMLGIRATDINGRGKKVQGDIVNGKGEPVTSFETNELGMGTVVLPEPLDSSDHYAAKVLPAAANGPQKMYALPAIQSRGNILSVKKLADKILLTASADAQRNDSVFIEVACRGAVYFDIRGRLKNGHLSYTLSSGALPAGILQFTMTTGAGKPAAVRLYFNERPENDLRISIAADSAVYMQRDLTKLTIKATDGDGLPVAADLSLAVMNKTQIGNLPGHQQNIRSYFLLSSDFKGTIENPGYYFNRDSNRFDDLDALLLTQDLHSYLYNKTAAKIIYQPEPVLKVSGTVKSGLFDRKQKKQVGLTMMSFGQTPSAGTAVSDSAGRFSFNLHNEFGEAINIILQSSNKSGAKKDYTITLDKKESPPIVFDQLQAATEPDSIVKAYVKKNIERKKAEDAFRYAKEGITLDEVILKSYALTPERKKVIDQYGNPRYIIDGKSIWEKEAKWSYGLYSVLLFNFPDKINIVRDENGNLNARVHNSEMTLVVIDGSPVREVDYPLIANIPPGEVSSFEIIEYAGNFMSLYCEVYPLGCATAPAWGNVIAIYTFGKKGIHGASRPVGIIKTTVPVFAAPREFSAPVYQQLQPADWLKPDLRSLLYWDPALAPDSTGSAVAPFYNADNPGTIKVTVEAITESGELGYQEFFYDVKKRLLQQK